MSYYEWLLGFIFPDPEYYNPATPYLAIEKSQYQKLMRYLYLRAFTWKIDHDKNRAMDGLGLRDIFEEETGLACEKSGPCSILEMFVGMANACEDDIMHDDDYGDRTFMWFWYMMENMGLDEYDDYNYDLESVGEIIDQFLARRYGRDGRGGPFYIPGYSGDMRKVELWYQLNYFIKNLYF